MEKKSRKKSALLTTLIIILITIIIIAVIFIVSVYLMNVTEENQYKKYSEEQQEIEIIQKENNEMLFKINDVYINKYGYIKTSIDSSAILLEGIKLENNQEQIQSTLFKKLLNLYETLETNDLINKVSKIDVSDLENIEIYVDSENKIIQIGNFENLNAKFVYAKKIMEQEKAQGTIFVKDINNVYFRENIL